MSAAKPNNETLHSAPDAVGGVAAAAAVAAARKLRAVVAPPPAAALKPVTRLQRPRRPTLRIAPLRIAIFRSKNPVR
jgi:hypothetical protein